MLFTADRGGDEQNHVYVRQLDGSVTDLTPGDEVKARYYGFTAGDRAFLVATNERDARWFDLYRYACPADGSGSGDYPRTLLYENAEGHNLSAVSLDGRWLALTRTRTNADDDVYLVDLASEERAPVHLTPHEGDVTHRVLTFTPDGTELYYTSDEDSEFHRLWAHELATGRRRLVLEAPWDVVGASFSRDGRYRVVTVNADARSEVTVEDLLSGEEVDVPTGGRDLDGVRFSRSGRWMAYYAGGDTSPNDLHVLDLESGRARRLTAALNPAVDESDLVAAEVVRFPSHGGLEIPALLYRPHVASADEPVPALLWMHGGPGGQSRHGYRGAIQFLVNHGYAILAVNNRGSWGYGKTFYHLDDRRHGEADLLDCVYAREWLAEQPWVDGERVGIMGGSYGGYLTVAALTFHPEVFAAGIDIFGVTNWLRTLESIPPWWAEFRDGLYAEMGDPATDRDRLHAISPLFHAERIRAPLLVVQGANDPRVLQVESDELVAAVRAGGTPVEYVVFPDEGHGFRSRENQITAAEAYLGFLERHLRRGATP